MGYQSAQMAGTRAKAVQGAITKELAILQSSGLVNCRVNAYPSRNCDTESLVLLLTNALRLRREGRATPIDLGR